MKSSSKTASNTLLSHYQTATKLKLDTQKAKDLRFAMSAGRNNEADLAFRLASNLTYMSEAELEELEAKDCSLILSAVAGFLA